MLLRVPFTGSENIGTGILQHRDDVGEDERLGELIFRCAEQARALPSPFSGLINEISAVALPDGDMLALQPAVNLIRP